MKKVILLVRVSTRYQDYTDQKTELKEFVKRDGYDVSEMEIIEDKESATKLSDEERQGLNKMFATINDPKNKIECVYCWELSRLSRRPETLYKVKGELVRHKIDLRTKHENLRLLNDNKELDGSGSLLFGIYVSFCENEITQRVQRSARSKRAKALQGIYTGGFIKYGYTVNEDKEYEKDKEQEEVVKLIFELYSTGKYGFKKLHREILSRGKNIDIRMVGKILRSREYTGEKILEHKITERIRGKERIITRYERVFPAIISPELFEKCREVAKSNDCNIDKSKNIYYANKLIKCSCCGGNLSALKNRLVYRCMNKYSPLTKTECSGTDSININVIDSILWNVARQIEIDFIVNFNEKQFEAWQKEIADLQDKIDNSENHYNLILRNEVKKLRKAISVETMPDKELEVIAIKQTKADKLRIEQEKINYQLEIDRLNKLIIEAQTKYNKLAPIPTIEPIVINQREHIINEVNNTDDKQRYDTIHKHIKQVSISKVPELTATKRIDIVCYNGETETYYYAFRIKDKQKQLYQIIKVDDDLEFAEYYNFEKRYCKIKK